MKLTAPAVARLTLPEGKSEVIVFDDDIPGFGVRMRAGGSRTWIVQYAVGRQQRRTSLGRVTLLPADKARKQAQVLLAKVRIGGDPQAEKFKARAVAAETLGAVAERFLERQRERLRPRTLAETERHLTKHWKPLHGVQIRALDRAMIAGHLCRLAAENGKAAADHARTSLSTLFTWATKDGLVDGNPVAATNRPLEPVSRDRILRDGELREIWQACRDDDHGRIVRLLLLTGQRREEISALRWSEIDADAALISLPKERTKNKRAHDVPLSDAALAVLPPERHGRELVFGEGKGAFTGFSAAKARLDARILAARRERDSDAKPMPEWRLHDLRRTAATRLADLGVQPHAIEAVLNHVSGHKAGVAGIYNRAAYTAEKRAALSLWGEHVIALVEGAAAKVVPLRRGAA